MAANVGGSKDVGGKCCPPPHDPRREEQTSLELQENRPA